MNPFSGARGNGTVDRAVFERLVPVARAAAAGVLGRRAPELLPGD